MKQLPRFLQQRLEWEFPAPHTHYGIPLGNGLFGALIWGEDNEIRITINRQDYWDHRGGMDFRPEATYANLKRWLQAGDEESLRRAFEDTHIDEHTPLRPTRLPMGRIDVQLAEPFRIATGGLDMTRGMAQIEFAPGGVLHAVIRRGQPVLALSVRGVAAEIIPRPVYHEEVLQHYRQYGFPPAQTFSEGDFCGWIQECPGEPTMCVGCLSINSSRKRDVFVCSVYGPTPEQARLSAWELVQEMAQHGYERIAQEEAIFWHQYWEHGAQICLPDTERELLYYLGMYKLAGVSWPGGTAATLQGPWIEEYRLPPWSGDYHFNINVQECYWPAFSGNQLAALQPLVEMIQSWLPKLRAYARAFVGIEDGLQLPHAVDDRCRCMGGFWTGSIDHGSTAWIGQIFWQLYRYTMDEKFLQEVAYPFLKGAMRVYEEMLTEEAGHYVLPVSVSPEYGGSEITAWGRNASFQLACIHFLCRALIQASLQLDVDADKRRKWEDIAARLPLAATDPMGQQIWLWEGQPLAESHRHHSHLAGLYPFDIFDFNNPQHKALLQNSLNHLTFLGMGLWSGWSFPWASILFARQGNGEMADLILGLFRRLFLNQGYASTHDAIFPGFTIFSGRPHIMQIEAALGAAAAVLEMLCHTRQGVLHIFPAVPRHWKEASFKHIRIEGAFLVSAQREERRTVKIEIYSEKGGELRLANPWQSATILRQETTQKILTQEAIIRLQTEAGEKIILQPADFKQ